MTETDTRDPNTLVRIVHPKVDGIGGPVTLKSLADAYSKLGWEEADADLVAAIAEAEDVALLTGRSVAEVLAERTTAGQPASADELSALSVGELRELAKARAVDVAGAKTRADLVAALRAGEGS